MRDKLGKALDASREGTVGSALSLKTIALSTDTPNTPVGCRFYVRMSQVPNS